MNHRSLTLRKHKSALTLQGGIVSSPAIGDNKTFFVGGLDGHLYAIRRR
jgi:hypothetical protein